MVGFFLLLLLLVWFLFPLLKIHRASSSSPSPTLHLTYIVWQEGKARKLSFGPGSQLLPMSLALPVGLLGPTLGPVQPPNHHARAERKQKQRDTEKFLKSPEAAGLIPWKHLQSTQSWNLSFRHGYGFYKGRV